MNVNKLIACCGLDCFVCPAFIAKKTNDQELRTKTAEQWSKQFNAPLKPADINCVGCTEKKGVHIAHCSVCEIRTCGQAKKVENCAHCADYPCRTLEKFIANIPPAKANIEAIRRSKTVS